MVFILFTCMFIMGLDRSSLGVAAPVIMKDLKIDAGTMGLALSAFFLTYTLLNLPAGSIADRYGAKPVLGWAVAIWSLASACTGLATGLLGLVAARLGVGTGEAALFPVSSKIAVDNIPSKDRGTAIGTYLSGARLGYAATPVVMGFLIAHYTWRFAFVITGMGSMLWCILWYFWYHEKPCATPAHAVAAVPRPRPKTPWFQLLTNRCSLGIFLAKFCGDYLYYMFLTWVPSYLVLERGFSILKMGFYGSLPFLTAFLVQPLAGYLSDLLVKRGTSLTLARKGVLVGAQLCGATIMIVGFVHDPMVAVAILTLNVAAVSTVGGMMFTLATEVAPEGMSATVTGSMNTVGALAGILAPTITGFIFKLTGSFQLALGISGLLLVLAALTVLIVIPDIKPMTLKPRPLQHP
ncbi:MAG: MFS transporter [Holophaga sp.]|nr:MFS transporter [Holophaga sp.]